MIDAIDILNEKVLNLEADRDAVRERRDELEKFVRALARNEFIRENMPSTYEKIQKLLAGAHKQPV